MKEWIWRYTAGSCGIGRPGDTVLFANGDVAFIATWAKVSDFIWSCARSQSVFASASSWKISGFFKSIRNLGLEFGVAGVLDDLTILLFHLFDKSCR
jgi:hypothetical protein